MAVYVRMSGRHVAERVRVPDGSPEDARLGQAPGWRRVDEPSVVGPVERPARSAVKDAWVAHAVAACGLSEVEANGLTKGELIELTELTEGDE